MSLVDMFPYGGLYSPIRQYNSLSGWWFTYPSEKYEFVSWDDYSQLNGTNKTNSGKSPYPMGKSTISTGPFSIHFQ